MGKIHNKQRCTSRSHDFKFQKLPRWLGFFLRFWLHLLDIKIITTSQGVCCCSQGACFSRPLWLFLDPESQSWSGCLRIFRRWIPVDSTGSLQATPSDQSSRNQKTLKGDSRDPPRMGPPYGKLLILFPYQSHIQSASMIEFLCPSY